MSSGIVICGGPKPSLEEGGVVSKEGCFRIEHHQNSPYRDCHEDGDISQHVLLEIQSVVRESGEKRR